MTVMAVRPKAAAKRGARPAPDSAVRPDRQIVLGPVRESASKSLLKLAGQMARANPEMPVHQHLQDAADQVRLGNEEGALRHLRAAAYGLQPRALRQHGIHDDRGHVAARQALEGVIRHHHLVKDIQDAEARNQANIVRQAMEDAYGSPALPSYGGDPGALAQKPVARQPGGDRAMNAPARTGTGRVDPNVADPVGPQPRGSKQFAYGWDDLAAVIELAAGPTMTKPEAGYRPGGTPGHRCGDCTMIRGDRCTLVKGLIEQDHVCDHFEPREGKGRTVQAARTWDDLASVIELAVQPGIMSMRTPATAGTARGHGRPDRSRPTWANVPRIPTTPTGTTGSRRREARQAITLARTAASRPLTGQPSTAGTARARTTSSPSVSHAITNTTGLTKGLHPASDTRPPNSTMSRSWPSTAARPKGQPLSPGNLGYPSRVSTTSSMAGHGLISLELSAPTSRPGASGASTIRMPGSVPSKSWPSTPGGARTRQLSAGSSAYPRRPSGISSTTGHGRTSLDLSAQTARLAATPAPYGRPGGPGLYHLKGNSHSPYFENIVQALMRKRGMSKGQASAVAWGALRRWSTGRNTTRKGHVTPVVQAAAGRALGQEAKAAAAARAAHAHAVTWDDLGAVVELAVVSVRTYQRTVNTPSGPRVQTVTQHMQNYKQGMGAPPPAGKAAKAQQAPGSQKHGAPPSKAAEKKRLLATAARYRRQAALLQVQENVLNNALMRALYGKNTTAAQAGATTAAQAGATTAAAPSAAQQAATAATTAGATAAQVTQAAQAATATAANMNVQQLQKAIAQVKARIAWLDAQAAKLTAQAAKL